MLKEHANMKRQEPEENKNLLVFKIKSTVTEETSEIIINDQILPGLVDKKKIEWWPRQPEPLTFTQTNQTKILGICIDVDMSILRCIPQIFYPVLKFVSKKMYQIIYLLNEEKELEKSVVLVPEIFYDTFFKSSRTLFFTNPHSKNPKHQSSMNMIRCMTRYCMLATKLYFDQYDTEERMEIREKFDDCRHVSIIPTPYLDNFRKKRLWQLVEYIASNGFTDLLFWVRENLFDCFSMRVGVMMGNYHIVKLALLNGHQSLVKAFAARYPSEFIKRSYLSMISCFCDDVEIIHWLYKRLTGNTIEYPSASTIDETERQDFMTGFFWCSVSDGFRGSLDTLQWFISQFNKNTMFRFIIAAGRLLELAIENGHLNVAKCIVETIEQEKELAPLVDKYTAYEKEELQKVLLPSDFKFNMGSATVMNAIMFDHVHIIEWLFAEFKNKTPINTFDADMYIYSCAETFIADSKGNNNPKVFGFLTNIIKKNEEGCESIRDRFSIFDSERNYYYKERIWYNFFGTKIPIEQNSFYANVIKNGWELEEILDIIKLHNFKEKPCHIHVKIAIVASLRYLDNLSLEMGNNIEYEAIMTILSSEKIGEERCRVAVWMIEQCTSVEFEDLDDFMETIRVVPYMKTIMHAIQKRRI